MNKEQTKKAIKPFVWGAVSGAVVLLIVIFSAGWVVTSSTAQAGAREISAKAVVDRLAPVCVIQFQQDPKKDEKLQALMKLDSWKRSDFVKGSGWATMPGEKEASSDVVAECTKLILALQEKSK